MKILVINNLRKYQNCLRSHFIHPRSESRYRYPAPSIVGGDETVLMNESGRPKTGIDVSVPLCKSSLERAVESISTCLSTSSDATVDASTATDMAAIRHSNERVRERLCMNMSVRAGAGSHMIVVVSAGLITIMCAKTGLKILQRLLRICLGLRLWTRA